MRMHVPAVIICTVAASTAHAGFVGWTSTVRSVSGGTLVNVFAVVSNSTDVLINVYGSNAQSPNAGYVTTTAAGGFIQGPSNLGQGLWVTNGSQSWTTLDSFLTVGGGLTSAGNWTGSSSTLGDPAWNVTYFDTVNNENTTVNAFSAASNSDGFTNPYINNIPALAGFFLPGGSAATARSLASLSSIRATSSNAAAAAGTHGMMIGQFFVAGSGWSIDMKLGATARSAFGTISQETFTLTVPAPGALAILATAGMIGARRRRG
jgi:hypothetical protein